MKKIFLILFFALVFVNPCGSFEINENEIKISGWVLKNESVTPLIASANSEDLGRVIYKTYERKSPRAAVEIILTEGKGCGSLYVPGNVDNSKKLMPASEYKILEIDGHSAILENQSYLPLALAIRVSDNVVLNIESSSLNQEELISIAKEILSLWKNTKSDSFPAR